jgi:hypothetical protein
MAKRNQESPAGREPIAEEIFFRSWLLVSPRAPSADTIEKRLRI